MIKNSKGNLRGMSRAYTSYESSAIKAAYEQHSGRKSSTGWLENLSIELRRSKPNISRYARSRGWTNSRLKEDQLSTCSVCARATRNKYFCSRMCQLTTFPNKIVRNKMGSTEQRKKSSDNMKNMWNDPDSKLNSEEHRQRLSDRMSRLMVGRIKSSAENYSRTKKGWGEFSDGKRYYFRSGWEMKYAAFLESLKKGKAIRDWTYEEDTFWFEKIKRGVRSYTPDFKIYYNDGTYNYHEVKGWMDDKSKTKLKRMRIYHPNETVVVIDQSGMKSAGLI